MSNVIGLKGTNEDRMANWLTLRMLKEAETVFKGTTEPQEIKIRDLDRRVYNKTLERYVLAA